jgi:hypothetical protein
VTIAMPFEGHVIPAALVSFARLVHATARAGLLGVITFSEGGVVDGARNRLVAQALETDPGTHSRWALVRPCQVERRTRVAGLLVP